MSKSKVQRGRLGKWVGYAQVYDKDTPFSLRIIFKIRYQKPNQMLDEKIVAERFLKQFHDTFEQFSLVFNNAEKFLLHLFVSCLSSVCRLVAFSCTDEVAAGPDLHMA